MGKVIEMIKKLVAWLMAKIANLAEGLGSKRIVVGLVGAWVIVKLVGAEPNVVAVCLSLLGCTYMISEALVKKAK